MGDYNSFKRVNIGDYNSFKGVNIGDYIGDCYRGYRGGY